jgi:hypothetical protein
MTNEIQNTKVANGALQANPAAAPLTPPARAEKPSKEAIRKAFERGE